MLKETLAFDSDDEYTFTGTETSPKEIVAVAIERAAIGVGVGVGQPKYDKSRNGQDAIGFCWKFSNRNICDMTGSAGYP
jgi:hypothetical protein